MLGDGLHRGLKLMGHAADWFRTAAEADRAIAAMHYDAVLLDLGLPDEDGVTMLLRWRNQGRHTPVVILTARDAVQDRIGGLDAGADDYLIKPVDLDELAARLRAVSRRAAGMLEPVWRHGPLEYHPAARLAVWHGKSVDLCDEAWGTTFEPAVIVYNRQHFAGAHVPGSRSGLARLLQEHVQQWRGKVVTYDVERSGVGYLLAQQDARMGSEFWYLAQALGRAGVRLSASTADMIEQIASGELVLGYNLLGSYALSLMERGAGIGVIAPRDYTLVMSRVAFIARRAPRPHAARLWLDYLLSREGQALLSRSTSQLYTIRTDTDSQHTANALAERLGYALKPISVGPGLLAAQDALRKRAFLARWREALKG